VNPDATVIANMTGTTPAAWNDPVKRLELTRGQIARARTWSTQRRAAPAWRAAGGRRRGHLSIGVDSNQNYLHPGSVLTSMLKRVDVAVYDAFTTGERLKPASTSSAWPRKAWATRSTNSTPS
jgi:basic membrane protein A